MKLAQGSPQMVIFDFDGVIIDSLAVVEEFDRWLYPGLTDEEWRETNYGNYFHQMQPHEHKRRRVSEEELRHRREEFYVAKSRCAIFPGMKECLASIRNDVICVLNSNSKLGGVLPFLQVHDLEQRFALLATKEVSSSKHEKLLLSLETYGVKKEDAVFVTDTVGDLLEAKGVGVAVIAVTWGVHTKQDFIEHDPFAIVNDAQELSAAMRNFFQGNAA